MQVLFLRLSEGPSIFVLIPSEICHRNRQRALNLTYGHIIVRTGRCAREELQGLRFGYNEEMFRELRTRAFGAGFDIVSTQSKLWGFD